MSLQSGKKLLSRTLWLVFLPLLVGWSIRQEWVMFGAVVLAVLWGVAARILWRCPYCDRPLGRPDGKITYCPHCGRELELDGE